MNWCCNEYVTTAIHRAMQAFDLCADHTPPQCWRRVMAAIGHNLPSLGDGWIARHRSVRSHWLVGHGLHMKPANPKVRHCLSQGEAWEDLLMECRYENGHVENGGQKMMLERGSLMGAVSWLAQRWNWTPQTVRTFLDKLESDGMISRHVPGASENNKHVGKKATVISVCNYDRFQRPTYACDGVNQQTNNKPTANEQQRSSKRPTNEQQQYKDNKGTKEQRTDEDARWNVRAVEVSDMEPVDATEAPRAARKTQMPKQMELVVSTPSPAPAPLMPDIDVGRLHESLVSACNGALDNPANCQGLLSMGEPIAWIRSGCDVDLDILPTLRAVGHKATGKRIKTWGYFSGPVYEQRDKRLGANRPPPRQQEPGESRFEKNRRMVREVMERTGGSK